MKNDKELKWVRQIKEFNTIVSDRNPSVVVGDDGVYVAYITFGITEGNHKTGLIDVAVTKLSFNGEHIWTLQSNEFNRSFINGFDSVTNDGTPSIVKNNGKLYISYPFFDIFDGLDKIFLFSLSCDGQFLWKQVFSEKKTSLIFPRLTINNYGLFLIYNKLTNIVRNNSGFVVAADGVIGVYRLSPVNGSVIKNILLNGLNEIPINIEPDIASNESGVYGTFYTFAGELVTFKLSGCGCLKWVHKLNGPYINPRITVYRNSVYVVATLQTSGLDSRDHLVIKYNENGELIWKKNMGFNTNVKDEAGVITADNNGVYVAFQTLGATEGNENKGQHDIAVFHLTHNGKLKWIKQDCDLNTEQNEFRPSIATENGNIYIAYHTLGSVGDNTNTGLRDIAIAKLGKKC